MRVGRRQLALNRETVGGVRRAFGRSIEVLCRSCGRVTRHANADVARPSRAARPAETRMAMV